MLSLLCMQKAFAVILLFIYTCVTSGFAVSTHYCMNEKMGVELGAAKADVCDKCGMHKTDNSGCCRDEVKVVKLQQDTQVAKVVLPSFALLLPVVVPAAHFTTPFYNFLEKPTAHFAQPPPLRTGLYIQYNVFRI